MSSLITSVLLVEDHPVIRQLMDRFLREQGNIAVWAIVPTAEEALERLATASEEPSRSNRVSPAAGGGSDGLPDLVLVDVSLPGMSGIELVGELSRLYPDLPCLMLSAHRNLAYVQQALDNGARGYVAKGYPGTLLEGVQRVLKGELFLSAEIRKALGR